MWKKIKPVLEQVLTSKKALAMLAGALVWVLAQAGVTATPEQILPVLVLIATYILGQGLADIGKEANKVVADSLGKPQASKAKKK